MVSANHISFMIRNINVLKSYELIINLFTFILLILVNIAGWSLAVLAITSSLLCSIQPILGCSIHCPPNESVCTCSNGTPKPIPSSLCGGLWCSDGGKCKPEENGCSAGM